jgi:hypothetical protein
LAASTRGASDGQRSGERNPARAESATVGRYVLRLHARWRVAAAAAGVAALNSVGWTKLALFVKLMRDGDTVPPVDLIGDGPLVRCHRLVASRVLRLQPPACCRLPRHRPLRS